MKDNITRQVVKNLFEKKPVYIDINGGSRLVNKMNEGVVHHYFIWLQMYLLL